MPRLAMIIECISILSVLSRSCLRLTIVSDLCHEDITIAAEDRLQSVYGREVGRAGTSRHIGQAVLIHGDT